jgi:hypothetical protein
MGSDLSGFMSESRKAEGVHDDIHAKALVLADDESMVAILCCDLLGIEADFARIVKQAIGRRAGIPPENVMICASHTHSAPAVHFLRGCGTPSAEYMRALGAKLVNVAKEAAGRLRPVLVGFGRTEYNLGYNRRELPRKHIMDQESGTVDNEVGILRLDEEKGKPFAVLYNYPVHPVTQTGTNKQISADYPGAASRLIESQSGAMAFFLQGCCGNVNPKVIGEFSVTEKAGAELAEKVLAAWKQIASMPDASPSLKMSSTELTLPLEGPPTVEQAQAEVEKVKQEIVAKGPGLHLRWRLHWAEDVLRHVEDGKAPGTVAAPVQALRIGDGAIVAIPGEEFVETGRRIKDVSPAREKTLVAAYSNSSNMGYVPIREAYPKMGYEVYGAHMWYGLFRLAPGGAEAITVAALSLLETLF